MYDIRQFRPTMYVLLALGFTGFAIATVAPGFWLIGMSLLGLNAWLLKQGIFRPLPRWLANVLTIAAAVYTASGITGDPKRALFPIGNFLLMLQLIKLYEQRGNRDYAQLLVLSLLLMVAAAISTPSLLFGLIFIVYLLLSPYACLLFHLKVETDHAKRQMGLDERQVNPLTLRQDQQFLGRSMKRLTGFVAAVATTSAILVFLFFPRGPGTNVFGWPFQPAMAATGMSEQIDMNSVTSVAQNQTQIASLRVTHNDKPVTSGEVYLRGNVYDIYDLDGKTWKRSSTPPTMSAFRAGSDDPLTTRTSQLGNSSDTWVQEFNPLKPIGVSFLVAMAGAERISVDRQIRMAYVGQDHVIALDAPLFFPLNYRVTSSGVMVYDRGAAGLGGRPAIDDLTAAFAAAFAGRGQPSETISRITQYARRPEVSGADADGRPLVSASLAPDRLSGMPPPVTGEVARHIEQHLQAAFTYTLNLDDERGKDDDTDPIVNFLYNSKKGWCEHYAGAMTLLCQSLGMKARLVSGYKCDEFNPIGGYFIVRQSHAHAWVEVLTRDGNRAVWTRFDPTSSREGASAGRTQSTWTRMMHLVDYLEHTWANSVWAYDANTQTNLLDNVESQMVTASLRANTAVREGGGLFEKITGWIGTSKYSISAAVIVILLSVISLIGVGLIAWYAWQRLRLMRRARRIGLDTLDAGEARRLARQLGFYDELIGVLERRRIVRAPHMTPMEFGHSLTFLSQEAYDTVVRLTRVFYRIRYGNAELSASQRRSLNRVIDRLQTQLQPRTKSR